MRQYRSRLNQVEEQKSIRSAVKYIVLTILVIMLLAIFGLKLFPQFTKLFVKNSTEETVQTNTLFAPNLQFIPENTNNESIVIKGSAQPNIAIKVYVNGNPNDSTTDDSGQFSSNIKLTKGENTIYAVTTDETGNESEKSKVYTVNYSNQTPNLTITKPQNNQTFYGTEQNISVEGSTDKGNTVTINDHIAILDSSGNFNYPISLNNGENNIKVVSTSEAGNKKEIELKVTYNP